MLLMFIPTLFLGLAFPAVCDALSDEQTDIADSSGQIYFLGNLGAALGAMVTGLLLIPGIGIRASGFGFAALSLCLTVACGALLDSRRLRRSLMLVGSAGALAVALVGGYVAPYVAHGELRWVGGAWRYPALGNSLLRYEPGASATVMVKDFPGGGRRIFIDDQVVASTALHARIDAKMLAHIPLLLHPDPARALTVGFGSGGTSYSMVQYGVQTDVVEIEPEVVASAPLFRSQNHDVLESPLLRVVLNDARNHLHTTRVKYDVISTDVTSLQYRQSSSLYTVEYFELMKKRLAKGGIACAWIPITFITLEELRILLRSFQEVFPHSLLWFMDQARAPFAILTGTEGVTQFDYARLKAGFELEPVRKDLESIGVIHPAQMLQFIYLDEHGYRKYAGEGPLHTDDYPILEFNTHVSFRDRGPKVRDRIEPMLALKPRNSYAFIRGVPLEHREDFDRHLEFARVWGEFTIRRLSLSSDESVLPGGSRRAVELLLRALELVPDYRFALEEKQALDDWLRQNRVRRAPGK
jgi:spermidine synthase